MATNGEIQFIADVLLMDKLAVIDAGLSKKAGVLDVVKGMAGTLYNDVKERVEKDGPLVTIGTFFTTGLLRRYWPIQAIAGLFGIDIESILSSMWQWLKPKIESGEHITPQEVNDKGKQIVEQHIGEPMPDKTSSDMFYELRKLDIDGKIVRTALFGRNNSTNSLSSLNDLLLGLSKTNKPMGKWTIGGIVMFFIKTVLWGAGLLAVGSAAKKITGIGDDDKKKEEQALTGGQAKSEEPKQEYKVEPVPWAPPAVAHSLTATGFGQTYFKNDGVNNIWYLPLRGNLAQTMISWAEYVYSELRGQENIIASTPAFNIMVSNLSKYIDGPNLIVPPNFHNLKEIVDCFAGQVARKLQAPEQQQKVEQK